MESKRRLALHHSLKVAHRVLRQIRVSKGVEDLVSVVTYANGREQGLCARLYRGLLNSPLIICWSEDRRSDQIVVYVSEPGERFENDTNVPTERAYREAKYFKPTEVAKAASYIAAVIRRAL